MKNFILFAAAAGLAAYGLCNRAQARSRDDRRGAPAWPFPRGDQAAPTDAQSANVNPPAPPAPVH